MKKTMAWALYERVFVIVHNEKEPDAAEYDDALDGYRIHYGDFDSVFIITRGGAPTPRQRKQTARFWDDRIFPRMVIITSSGVVRGVITALNWFTQQRLRPFPPEQFDAACRYLDLTPEEREGVRETSDRLFAQLEAARPEPSAAAR